jgi:hypothetical protein
VVGRAEGGSAKEEAMRDEVYSKRRRIWYQLAMKTLVACSRKGATGRRIIQPREKRASRLDALFFCSRPGYALCRVRPSSYNYK